jgi:hypothetical protein
MTHVIFSIDEPRGLLDRARFLRHLSDLTVMGKLSGSPLRLCLTKQSICTQGDGVKRLAPGYILAREDYELHVLRSGWVNGQPCVQLLSGGTIYRATTALEPVRRVGEFRCVGSAPPAGDWVFTEDTQEFWVAGR